MGADASQIDALAAALAAKAEAMAQQADQVTRASGLQAVAIGQSNAPVDTGAHRAGIGMDVPAIIGRVVPGLPAEKAGLKPGDRIVSAAGRPVGTYEDLAAAIVPSAGRPLRQGPHRRADSPAR